MAVTAKCTSCGTTTSAEHDAARAAGWRIWDGQSVTGKDIQARVCPVCVGGREGEEPPKPGSWRVGCRTCDWEWDDEYGEGPLTEKDAQSMARDHECEPDTWVKPRRRRRRSEPPRRRGSPAPASPRVSTVDLSGVSR